ncbi:hypothetical protein UPYG_G00349750 [Umbra pygmaea]|uniref:SCP domain-containing protein n=1 Tax=Umbra pygmaea TaxID=75934 RepID=A0ABD0VY55_UMBPY
MIVFICVTGVIALMQPYCSLADVNTSIPTVRSEIVNKHNELRRGVQPPATNMKQMNWDKDAAANALKWANQCRNKESPKKWRKISNSRCGENRYVSSNERPWTEVIQSWYNENKDYSYKFNGPIHGKAVNHYTQVVWANSDMIGCAVAFCPKNKFNYFYVCHYCPPGNVIGRKPYKTK